jgi:hypothetical protein
MKYIRQIEAIWIFRLLVVIGCGLMLVSFGLPWWQASRLDVRSYTGNISVTNAITIYGFGLRHNLVQLASYLTSDLTPLYQTILAWSYIVVSICLALASTWLGRIKGTLLLGFTGIGYIAYVVIAGNVIISNRLTGLGFAAQGVSTTSSAGAIITMQAEFTAGYYIALAAGGLLFTLAMLRYLIKGTPVQDKREKTKVEAGG